MCRRGEDKGVAVSWGIYTTSLFGGLGIDSIRNSGRTMRSGVEIRTRVSRVLLK